ncbi:MAG: hypothetical protein RPU39_10340 [Candidatus Sedimenticola sp. (ex Thyasira tokunagai)]
MKRPPYRKLLVVFIVLSVVVLFFHWRYTRTFNIFDIGPLFEYPVSTDQIPEVFESLSAKECGKCHQEFYQEWITTIHSQSWTDPYFQSDWKFDGSRQICKNCHTPLDKQQEHKVLGYSDSKKWDPILEPNPDFDTELQHEGVTCNACHLREGKIRGVYGVTNAPHPIEKIEDPNIICMQCHLAENTQWDVFYTMPPCSTVAEIKITMDHQIQVAKEKGISGEIIVPDEDSLKCVNCHMPLVERPLVEGGEIRKTRRHLWRGGHDKDMVKNALEVTFIETSGRRDKDRIFDVTLTNVGAAHYLPTGSPGRHLSVDFNLLDSDGDLIDSDQGLIIRKTIWQPFIFDLSDNRLMRWKPETFRFSVERNDMRNPVMVEVIVKYHLLEDEWRKLIGYENKKPIFHELYRKKIEL